MFEKEALFGVHELNFRLRMGEGKLIQFYREDVSASLCGETYTGTSSDIVGDTIILSDLCTTRFLEGSSVKIRGEFVHIDSSRIEPGATVMIERIGRATEIESQVDSYPVPETDLCEETLEEGLLVKVYPSPTSGIIQFVSQEDIQVIQVFDASGQIKMEQKPPKEEIDLSQFEKGVYLIKFVFSEKVSVERVLLK